MTTDKRKEQYKKASKRNREQKKASGFVDYRRKIKPEWKIELDEKLKELENEAIFKKKLYDSNYPRS